MRLRHLAFVLPLALLAVGLPSGFAAPRSSWDLAARVPASCIAFVSVEDIQGLQERSQKTALVRMFRDPAMRAFVDPLEKAFQELAGPDVLPPEVKEVLKLAEDLRGQLGVAFLGMDEATGGPVLVASLDFGTKVGELGAFLQRLAEQAGGSDVELVTETRDGRTWWNAKVRRGQTLAATTVDTTFVVATSAALLASVVGAPAAQGSLAASPDYQGVLGRVGREGLALFAYGNVPAALAAFARDLAGRERNTMDALGLDTVKALAYGMSFAGDGFRDTIVVHAPGADHGLVPLIRMAPIERPRLLGLVPGNAFAFAEENLPLDTLLASVRKLVSNVDAGAAGDLDEGLAQANRMVGVDLEKDVLAGLGGTLGWYASLSQGGGLYPEVAVMATVKDPAAYEQVLTRLCDGIAGAVNEEGRVIVRTRVMEYEGQRLHLMELQRAQGQGIVPFTPSWTLLGDRLVVTLVPYTLKEIVWRATHPAEAGPGLDAQEDFRALWAEKPATAGEVGYFDLQAVLALFYDTGVPLLQSAVKPNVLGETGAKLPLDWAALPPARVVRPYFRSLMGFTTWGPDGIEMRLHSPIPLLPIVMFAGASAAMLGGRVATRSMGRPPMPAEVVVREAPEEPPMVVPAESEEERVRRDLDELMRFVRLFIVDQKALPKQLDDLVTAEFIDVLPQDPWERPYRLVVTDAAAKSFQVVSDGPDGKAGTSDDIAVSSKAPGPR